MNHDEIFKKTNQPYKGGQLLKPLIALRGRQCELCKNTTWCNQPITLQVHHIDGDRCNNTLENLQLLCPNCHSYTDNFGSKNRKKKQTTTDEEIINALNNHQSIRQALLSLGLSDGSKNYERARKIMKDNNLQLKSRSTDNTLEDKKCKICGTIIGLSSNYCSNCNNISQRKVKDRPNREQLKEMIRKNSFLQIGKKYKVSDNAIRKWCDFYGLPRTKNEINSYSDEEWENI